MTLRPQDALLVNTMTVMVVARVANANPTPAPNKPIQSVWRRMIRSLVDAKPVLTKKGTLVSKIKSASQILAVGMEPAPSKKAS